MSRNRQRARERARRVVVEQSRARARRRRLALAGAGVAAVLATLATLVVVRLTGGSATSPIADVSGPAPAVVVEAVSGVPAGVLDAVGRGTASTLPVLTTGQSVLTSGGKPLVVYLGAEYCPYCAAQRWAVVVALSRFGAFSGLGQTRSAGADVFPNTATLSFHGASYRSRYLTFQGVETQSNRRQGSGYATLDEPTAEQQALLRRFDAPPYVDAQSTGAIPFIDFANQAVASGASFSPQVLAGRSVEQIARTLSDPSSPITRAVGGAANALTTVLCQLTGGQPGAVCVSAAGTAYQGQLHAAH